MKKQILEALKTKFEGVNEQILGRVAEKLAKTTTKEEDITTAVEGVTFQSLLEQYGDSRANEAQQTAIKNYETKHNLKDGKPTTKPNKDEEGGKGDDDDDEKTPKWAKAIMESNKALQAELNAIKAGKITDSRKSELSTIIKDLPESLRKAYERTPVDSLSDDEFSALKDEVKGEVEKISTDISVKGALFGAPRAGGAGGNGKTASEAEVKDVINQLHI